MRKIVWIFMTGCMLLLSGCSVQTNEREKRRRAFGQFWRKRGKSPLS